MKDLREERERGNRQIKSVALFLLFTGFIILLTAKFSYEFGHFDGRKAEQTDRRISLDDVTKQMMQLGYCDYLKAMEKTK